MIDENKALELIAQGEGQHVELKREVPSKVRELSEEVCALANATGGYIIIGVDNNGQFTEGFTINNSKRSALRDSVDQIEPQVECETHRLVSGIHTSCHVLSTLYRAHYHIQPPKIQNPILDELPEPHQ